MNYLTNMKNISKLSQQDLHNPSKSSWHDQYKDSAWIYIGGLPFDLTEGDIICIFSQYGEVVNINLIRAKDTGKSKGYCFLCYEDQRSTILAVDNLNGIKIMNRSVRVDHVEDYKMPKDDKKANEETKRLYAEGCAPKAIPPPVTTPVVAKAEPPGLHDGMKRETLVDQIDREIKLPARLPIYSSIKIEKISDTESEKPARKDRKKKSKKKKKSKNSSDESNSSGSDTETKVKKVRSQEDRKKVRNVEKNTAKYSSKYSHSGTTHVQSEQVSDKHRNKDSAKHREHSRSPDRSEKPRPYKRDFSPSIPKRWR